jgi:hypothetical protein
VWETAERLAIVAGGVLKAVFGAILLVRRPRPIHARGVVLSGEMTWLGTSISSGISWVDDAPRAPVSVTARVSRSAGLPAPLPDVIGLALRVTTGEGSADLELASTGIGVPGRFMLVPRRSPSRATYGMLIPYRSSDGPILICARSVPDRRLPSDLPGIADALAVEPWRLRLYFARPTGLWHVFAEMTLQTSADQDDHALRFDAQRRAVPGAASYRWEWLARQPSYRLAQRRGTSHGR